MPIRFRISPLALAPGGALVSYTGTDLPLAQTLQYPRIPTLNSGSSLIATVSPLTFRSNINEDGTFPIRPANSVSQTSKLLVHVSTSGSATVHHAEDNTYQTGFSLAYGLYVSIQGTSMHEDIFERALNDTRGSQFKANLQELIARSILEVRNQSGAPMSPSEIGSYIAP
jgi:hypothetical protein